MITIDDITKAYGVVDYMTTWCFVDYLPMFSLFGNVLYKKDIGNYQGDSLILFEKEGAYGYFCFGWGSCCGCDALQACHSNNDLLELAEGFSNRILWFDSAEECITFMECHDWEGDYMDTEECEGFAATCINLLTGNK